MKPEYIKTIREDFPDLLSADTTIDETMPDAWREAIRGMLVAMRVIKFGRRHGVAGGDIHVRSIAGLLNGKGVGYGRPTPTSLVLDVQFHTRAPERTKRQIKLEISLAKFRCGEAHAEALRQEHLLDIVHSAQRYVRAMINADTPLKAADVVFSSAYDSDEVRHLMPRWAVMAVDEWLQGGSLGNLTVAEKYRLIRILKSVE